MLKSRALLEMEKFEFVIPRVVGRGRSGVSFRCGRLSLTVFTASLSIALWKPASVFTVTAIQPAGLSDCQFIHLRGFIHINYSYIMCA